MNDPDEDMFFGLRWILTYGIAIFFLVLACVAGVYCAGPYFINKETKTNRESNQFITTKQHMLRAFKTDYDQLSIKLIEAHRLNDAQLTSAIVSQQKAIVLQMRQEADLIPEYVQHDIKEFLRSSP